MHSLAFGLRLAGHLTILELFSGFGAALSYELVYDPIPIWNVLANEFLSTPQGTSQSGDLNLAILLFDKDEFSSSFQLQARTYGRWKIHATVCGNRNNVSMVHFGKPHPRSITGLTLSIARYRCKG